MNVKLVRAFIASPSGLDEERRVAHLIAQQVNDTVAREMSGRLELIGWEETLSGIGRPQALINADMETCDLFIGAMWTKWGTKPALAGPYTSGFEEEFELSWARHQRTGSPFMTVFFKDIDPLQLADPGDELKKVLAFQERLRAEKALLYETFGTAEAFAEKVRAFLTRHTIRLLQRSSSSIDKNAAESLPGGLGAGPVRDETQVSAPTSADTIEASFLISTATAFSHDDGPSPTEVARLRLIGAVAGTTENDSILVGAHDANLLYQERESYALSPNEKRGLLYAGLAAIEDENIPVWTWLAALSADRQGLLSTLTLHGDENRRIGAFTAMRLLADPINLPRFFDPDEAVVDYWLSPGVAADVRVAALRYLRDHGESRHLDAISIEVGRGQSKTLTPALEATLAIKLRISPMDAAQYVLSSSFETLDDPLLSVALDGLTELGNESLTQGLDHRSASVRARALETLSARGAIGLDVITRATDDDAPRVRLAALRSLERLNQPFSLDEARTIMVRPRRGWGLLGAPVSRDTAGEALFGTYVIERLQQMSVASVEALLSSTGYRDLAYLNLAARRSGECGHQLRADLEDLFETYAARHWPDGIKSEYPASLLALGTAVDPLEAKRRDLVRQGLDVVARQRDEKDLRLVRLVLDSKFVSPTIDAVEFIRTLGGPDDVERLGRAGRSFAPFIGEPVHPTAFDFAARAILRIRPDVLSHLTQLDLPDAMFAKIVESASNEVFERLPDGSILVLLLTEKLLLRRAVARKIPASLARRRVRRLLDAYRADPEGRYYVVPYWLDLGLAFPRRVARRVVLAKT